MPNLTPAQKQLQDRFEALIGAAAPFLDLILAVGDRISRIAEPEDHDYYAIRTGEQIALPGEPDSDQPDQPVEGSAPELEEASLDPGTDA